ncbi:hypothetical protein [Cryobacterium tepidiphilum]|uniref:Uncharacterized protein n=1 Tax=Cryobacterium tepidiphilum TaxID=2486026 RepID=A0A3M8L1G7_9MICO|nr:hypothetical protein [Cryobacterium tepidiphilum]RNE59380.1 hypothetical protein EEJ31_10110 [Cryobacterium tepidiphilum]
MDYTVAGLPLHILLNHAVVVLVPLTAGAVALHALWPVAARRLGIVTPLAALVVLVLTPITVQAGEALERAVGVTPAIQRHHDLGEMLLPWVIGLFVVAVAEWLWSHYGPGWGERMRPRTRTAIRAALAVAAVVVAAGSVVMIVLIGDAGARAVWSGVVG